MQSPNDYLRHAPCLAQEMETDWPDSLRDILQALAMPSKAQIDIQTDATWNSQARNWCSGDAAQGHSNSS